jgi:hypothetical protein
VKNAEHSSRKDLVTQQYRGRFSARLLGQRWRMVADGRNSAIQASFRGYEPGEWRRQSFDALQLRYVTTPATEMQTPWRAP